MTPEREAAMRRALADGLGWPWGMLAKDRADHRERERAGERLPDVTQHDVREALAALRPLIEAEVQEATETSRRAIEHLESLAFEFRVSTRVLYHVLRDGGCQPGITREMALERIGALLDAYDQEEIIPHMQREARRQMRDEIATLVDTSHAGAKDRYQRYIRSEHLATEHGSAMRVCEFLAAAIREIEP